jgi:hypothetical protein
MNLAILGLMHKPGHVIDEGKGVEWLARQADDASVELAHIAEFGHDRDEPSARFLGRIDHRALAIVHGGVGVSLQHPEIATYNAGWGAKLVNR